MRMGSDQSDQILSLTNQGAGTVNGDSTEVGEFPSVVAFLNASAVTGTLDVKLQDSPNGTDWYDIPNGAFTQATAAGTQRLSVSDIGMHLRAVATVGGTTPSVTATLSVVGNR